MLGSSCGWRGSLALRVEAGQSAPVEAPAEAEHPARLPSGQIEPNSVIASRLTSAQAPGISFEVAEHFVLPAQAWARGVWHPLRHLAPVFARSIFLDGRRTGEVDAFAGACDAACLGEWAKSSMNSEFSGLPLSPLPPLEGRVAIPPWFEVGLQVAPVTTHVLKPVADHSFFIVNDRVRPSLFGSSDRRHKGSNSLEDGSSRSKVDKVPRQADHVGGIAGLQPPSKPKPRLQPE